MNMHLTDRRLCFPALLLSLLLTTLLLLTQTSELLAGPPRLPQKSPAEQGLNAEKLAEIDQHIADGITAGDLPGCVVLIAHRGAIVWRKAYGQQQVQPTPELLTTEAIFDLASLTKPIATATSIMHLVEAGQLNLDERVATYWPEFGVHGKAAITLRQLLTHQSGLIADNALRDYLTDPETSMQNIAALKLVAPPGERFIYSDVGFLVLGELIRRVSGDTVDVYASQHLYKPLGMRDTAYGPVPAEKRDRVVPTEQRQGAWIRGEVHDPLAFRLQGVAGHAGLFSTADDLAIFGQMLLNGGEYQGVRILSAETVKQMTTPHSVPGKGVRCLGWDMQTGYSSNRGKNFSPQAYGHGGFTGTAFWNDPTHELTVIFLSSRLHPHGKGAVNRLAGQIGTIAVEALSAP